ncbi:EamA family transporter [Bacillus sp. FJAT-49732]|uniref:EamA family transporter n=1 Tax=Lederbergia citrisecunda TaxID=2833583 RepID=A0A942TNY1_9BACI|nr:DMT family transporter [Lederbergia citrisecunda]MBS4201806.1 EamA family transporter [Lederbergia citrisecunda]
MKTWQYALIVFLGGCSYGVLSTVVKLAYGAGFSVTEVIGGQYFFGVLLIWLIFLFTKKQKMKYKQLGKLLLSGLPFGLTGVFYYQALQSLNASLAIIFLFQFVWIGTFIDWALFKKKPDFNKIISIIILILGSVLAAGIVVEKGINVTWQGSVWGILSAITFTVSIFLSGSVEKQLPPVQRSTLIATGAFITASAIFPPVFLADIHVAMGVAPYGLFLGLFGVALPPLLFSIGMPHVGPSLGTILSASELPVAVTMASIILAEHVGLSQWFGVVLILGGIIFGNVQSSKPSANPLSINKLAK